MFELILIYKTRQENRIFTQEEDALEYFNVLPRKPSYGFIVKEGSEIVLHFMRR